MQDCAGLRVEGLCRVKGLWFRVHVRLRVEDLCRVKGLWFRVHVRLRVEGFLGLRVSVCVGLRV